MNLPQPSSQVSRRSRLRRRPTHNAIEITSRDFEIFQLLNRYRYLRSTFIHAFVGGHRGALIKRLGTLYHNGYLDRPKQQWQAINARYMPAVYELGIKAEQTLRAVGVTITRMPSQQFAHCLMICEILSSIEIGILADPSLRMIPQDEIIARMPATTQRQHNPLELPCSISYTFPRSQTAHRVTKALVPDAVFGIEYIASKSYRFFALEADRNNEPVKRNNLSQTSYLRKLLQYREIAKGAYKTHWGLPNLLVLNVTTSEPHMRSILKLVDELTGGHGASYLLFKTMPSLASLEQAPLPDPAMLREPWERAGHQPFAIHKT